MTRCALILLAAVLRMGAEDTPTADPQAYFRDHVRPILQENCWRCHGEKRQRAGLRLDSRAGVLRGGHNPIVVPGHPEQSRLMDVLSYEDDDAKMPPDGKLPAAEIAAIAEWIRMGVPWEGDTASSSAAGSAPAPAADPPQPKPATGSK
jgi:hypothetical protein